MTTPGFLPSHCHAPPGYDCPFCRLARGESTAASTPDHVILRSDDVFVVMSSRSWTKHGGNVLVVPALHFENLYVLPVNLALPIHQAARDTALAMKRAFGCGGISTRQHNETVGNQDVWHYHLHVFPRFAEDNLYGSVPYPAPGERRASQAAALRAAF